MMASDRYIRQESLKVFGPENQNKLRSSKVLIVGLGGLGIPVAQYLNAIGVGTLGLVENDSISLHNLQRQVLYAESDIGKAKLAICLSRLQKQNSETIINTYATFLTSKNALDIIKDYDIIVDATDNFETRYLINDSCVILNKTFVYGALHSFEGQVSVFNYKKGPTYRCLYPVVPSEAEIPNCDENGVLGVLPGIIGTLQALEVVKVITEIGEVLSGKLLLFDGLSLNTRKINFKSRLESFEIKQLQEDYSLKGCSIEFEIIPEKFEKLLMTQDVQLIDVRKPEEFASNHLEKAINIPLSDFNDNTQKIDLSRPVYIICQSGKRSIQALNKLQNYHSKAIVFSVAGGMNKFQKLCH